MQAQSAVRTDAPETMLIYKRICLELVTFFYRFQSVSLRALLSLRLLKTQFFDCREGNQDGEMMNVPVFAIVENMSYYERSDCGKRHSIWRVKIEIAKNTELKRLSNCQSIRLSQTLAIRVKLNWLRLAWTNCLTLS